MKEEWLELLKSSLNIEADETEKDSELLFLLRSASAHCLKATNRTEAEILEEGGGDWPEDWINGVVLLAKHQFETGGTMIPSSLKENPYGAERFINQFYMPLT